MHGMHRLAVGIAVGMLVWIWTERWKTSRSGEDRLETYREQLVALRPELVRLVRYRYAGLGDECEDAVGDALLDLLNDAGRVLHQIPTPERLVLYARRAALNKAADLCRKRARSDEFPDGDPQRLQLIAPEDTTRGSEQHEDAQRIRAALERLPEMQRAAVTMKYFMGLSCAEIAQSLGTSEKSVTRLLTNGRQRLARILADEQGLLP